MLHTRPETFDRKHSLVAHRRQIVSQFKAHSVTGSGHGSKVQTRFNMSGGVLWAPPAGFEEWSPDRSQRFSTIFGTQDYYYYYYFFLIPSVVKIPRVKSYKKLKTNPLVARGPNLVESCREEGLHYIIIIIIIIIKHVLIKMTLSSMTCRGTAQWLTIKKNRQMHW